MIKKFGLSLLAIGYFFTLIPNTFAGGCGSCALPVLQGENKAQRTDHRGYAGLAWKLDGSLIPDLSFGFRSLRVDSNDHTEGFDLNGRVSLKDKTFDSVRLSYTGGNRDIQGSLGLGYSLSQNSLLGTAAINAEYIRLGSDYLVDSNAFSPYIEANSLGKPDKVQSTQVFSCAAGTLQPVTDLGGGNYTLTNNPGPFVDASTVYHSSRGLQTCY